MKFASLLFIFVVTGVNALLGQEILPDPEDILNDENGDTEQGAAPQPQPARPVSIDIEDLSPGHLREILTERLVALRKVPTEKGLHLLYPLQINENERGPVIGYVDTEYRYRIEKRKIPRYKYDYEEYEEYALVPASNDPYEKRMVRKRVKRQRITSHRVIGHDTKEVKVADPEGPHSEIRKTPEYEKASSAYVHHGAFGSNAMAFLGMLKCGLPPDDEQFRMGVDSLTNALIAYGAPDRTWDMAWLVALYCNLPQENKAYKDWTQKLVGKLVAGANQKGAGAGLWGPNCVNPEYLAAIVQYDQRYRERYLEPIDRQIRTETRERSKKRLEDKKRALLDIHEKWSFIYNIWGSCGRNIYAPTEHFVIPAEVKRQSELMHTVSGRMPGLTYDFTRFQMADLEATAIALFALKEASIQNCLPKETPTPYDIKLKPLAKAISTRGVMERALKALLDVRDEPNGWSSCTIFGEHKDFDRIALNDAALKASDYQNLPKRSHAIYQAMACASLRYVAQCLEGNSAKKASSAADTIIPSVWPKLQQIADDLVVENIPGRHASLWHMAELCGDGSRMGRQTWEKLALALLKWPRNAKANKSNWSRTPANFAVYGAVYGVYGVQGATVDGFLEVSTEELLLRQYSLAAGNKQQKTINFTLNTIGYNQRASGLFYPPAIVSEATILAFISSGIRPPAFAIWQIDENRDDLPGPVHVICNVYKRLKVNVAAIKVGASLPLAEIINTPFVVVERANGRFTVGESAAKAIQQYLSLHKGTLVVLCDDGDDGSAWWLEVRTFLEKQGLTGKESISETRGITVRSLMRSDHPVAICIQSPENSTSAGDVARVLDSLLKRKLPPIYFQSDYPLMLDRLEN